MADYWRSADRAPVSVHPKRPRADYDEVPPGSTYLPREEPRYDDRDARFAWRESEPVAMGNMNAYAPPGTINASDVPGVGGPQTFMGATASGQMGVPNMPLPPMNDPTQGGRLVGAVDPSLLQPPMAPGRLDYLPGQDTQPVGPVGFGMVPPDATPTLYVEGIPSDCTRREAAHIFRPFVGFKEVRLVRKDAKRPGGDQFMLCFVDFTDPRCASIALEALQGYKFDETDRNSEMLRLQYSRFPGSRPAPRDGPRGVRDRDSFPPNRPFRH